MKPKIIVDSENEHIVRYWKKGLGKGSYPTTHFEVIINADYAVYQLESLIHIFQRAINDARKERSEVIARERSGKGNRNYDLKANEEKDHE